MALFDAAPQKTAQSPGATTAPVPAVFSQASAKNSLVQIGLRNGGRRVQANKNGGGGPITILIQGSKDSAKSTSICGLAPMRPPGTRFVLVSFDETSLKSLWNYYGREWVDKNVEVYELAKRIVEPVKDAQGNPVMEPDPTDPTKTRQKTQVIYPGYDPNEPRTAEDVVGEFSLLLDDLERAGNVWGFVVDHFQFLWEGVLRGYAAHLAGYTSIAAMKIDDWGPRTDVGLKSEAKTRRIVPFDGGIVAITGYAPEVKNTMKKVPDGKGGMKTTVVKEIKSPPWLRDDIIRNWDVMLDMKLVGETKESTTTTSHSMSKHDYMVEVLTSKVRRFPKGATVNITGSSLAKFWEPETVGALQDLADKMEATT